MGAARGRARQRDPRRHAGADGRVFHADRAGAREGARAGAGVGAAARPRADLARAAVHRERRHAAVTQGQGRGARGLGRAGRAVGRLARRPAGGHRGHGVERAWPGRNRASSRRWLGGGGSAVARGAGPGGAEGPSAGVGEAAGLDPARPGQAAGPGDAGRVPADERGRRRGSCCSAWPRRPCPGGAGT